MFKKTYVDNVCLPENTLNKRNGRKLERWSVYYQAMRDKGRGGDG